ncbi:MAG TPA: transaldolase family protein [Streptosporangiaceae bacterium]|nr:transaldolase family protein [Streptosporangiaceae bacterium]
MRIFFDGADADALKPWVEIGVVKGVTTNLTMLRARDLVSGRSGMIALAKMLAPLPLSVMTLARTATAIRSEARRLREELGENVVIKVPVVDPEGAPMLDVVHALAQDGIPVNATACLSMSQALLASEAGATYVSLLAGRVADEGGDAVALIERTRAVLAGQPGGAQLLVASVRTIGDAHSYMLARPDIVTLAPPVLRGLMAHRYSQLTAAELWGPA